ncbi:MAG TPA: redoxin domain-containing protein [Burkholderiales bacterium]|nr:redoxin domain-containing protein [Burkholderiales bacterium]
MLGKPVPDFSLPSTGGGPFRLSSARTSKLVLYFYPKDNPLRRFARRAAVRRDQDENMYGRKVRVSSAAPS